MTADKHPLSDQELDALFESTQGETPETPVNLVAAVLADAADIAAIRQPSQPATRARATGPGWFASFLNGIGGWQGVATVAASAVFGLWVGYADLSAVPFVGDLGLQVDLMLNGSTEFNPITTFDDFTLDG